MKWKEMRVWDPTLIAIFIILQLNFVYSNNCVHLFPCTDGWQSASLSEEEDDEDGEWIDVHHSSDEEQQEVVSVVIIF